MSFIDHIVITLSAKLCDKKQKTVIKKKRKNNGRTTTNPSQTTINVYHWDLINCILQFCKNANCIKIVHTFSKWFDVAFNINKTNISMQKQYSMNENVYSHFPISV